MIEVTSKTALPVARIQELKETAQRLEASFATEMLKAAGMSKPMGGTGGGIGEEQFSSFLLEQRATALVAAGGLGLSDSILASLIKSETANDIG